MQTRNRKTKDPCPQCFLHKDLCLCDLIPQLDLKTRLCLVVHTKELKRTTNTGRLAVLALRNSEMRVRGEDREGLDLGYLLDPKYRPLFFFPAEDAIELTTEFVQQDPRPVLLIVPDGNWRQASKVHSRHPELKDVPRVKISTPNTSLYHLRAEKSAEGMATLQAIASAFGFLEGPEARDQLMKLYEEKLHRTLKGRGVVID